MQTSTILASARTSSTTAAGILNRLATTTYQPKWKVEVAEWDPSQDEKVSTPVRVPPRNASSPRVLTENASARTKDSALWGAVGGEQRARRTKTAVGWPPAPAPAPYSGGLAPAWPPFQTRAWAAPRPRVRETMIVDRKRMRDEAYALTESFNPFNPINIALREWKEQEARLMLRGEEECVLCNSPSPMEEWEALTESFNPFNPVNVQARADAEVRYPSSEDDDRRLIARITQAKERDTVAGTSSPEPDTPEEESHASIRSRAWQRAMARVRPEARPASASASSAAETHGEHRTPSPKADSAKAPGVGVGVGASPQSDGGSDSTRSSWASSKASSPWSTGDSEVYGTSSSAASSSPPSDGVEHTTWPPKPLGRGLDFGGEVGEPRGIVVEPEEVGWMNFSFLD
ncbi:hypothetical protein C8Q78DRAFT_988288 [Trametes maxima]|nr:hypothetical protein C8Q78DRAFT_988288 [Trametes maxima]